MKRTKHRQAVGVLNFSLFSLHSEQKRSYAPLGEVLAEKSDPTTSTKIKKLSKYCCDGLLQPPI
jgi:hypothetical protein